MSHRSRASRRQSARSSSQPSHHSNSKKRSSYGEEKSEMVFGRRRQSSKRRQSKQAASRYMFEYQVKICTRLNCKDEDCFDSHDEVRRVPRLLDNGKYSYSAQKCWYIHQGKKCPNGFRCKNSHTREETLYHPMVYKTSICQYGVNMQGECTGYGKHCPKAHGVKELRMTQQNLDIMSVGGQYSQSGFHYANPANDFLVYLVRYKTEKCTRKPCSRTCEKYHSLKERRRSPLDYFYSEQPCPNVKTGSSSKSWGDPSKCVDGDECEYSHTLLEQMYHPNIYKTEGCNKYDPTVAKTCSWGSLCTHSHGEEDEVKQQATLKKYELLLEKGDLDFDDDDFPSEDEEDLEHKFSESVPVMFRPVVRSKPEPVSIHSRSGSFDSKMKMSVLRASSSPLKSSPVNEFSSFGSHGTGSPSPIRRPQMMDSRSSFKGLFRFNTHDRQLWSPSSMEDDFINRRLSYTLSDSIGSIIQESETRPQTKRTQTELTEIEKRVYCPICETNYRESVIIDCGHSLCGSCSQKAVRQSSCSVCGMTVTATCELNF